MIYTSCTVAGASADFAFTFRPLLALFYFCVLSGKIKKGEVGGACSIREAMRNAYRILATKPEKMSPGRTRHRWNDNITLHSLKRLLLRR